MKQIYIAANSLDAQMLKDYLESTGIQAIIKGDYLTGAVGEIPANTFPTVWVVDEEDEVRAKKLVANFESEHPSDQIHITHWHCPQCKELIEPQFTQCWHCGYQRGSD